MNRARWRRCATAVLGMWFVAATGGVFPPAMPDMAAMTAMPGMAVGGHQSSTPCAPDARHRPSSDSDRSPSVPAKGPCSQCPCACCAPVVTLIATRWVAVPVAAALPVAAPSPRSNEGLGSIGEQVVLPPPLGPPTARA